MNQIGCIIGRFQPLHKGHNLLIEASLKENDFTIIFIGSSESQNDSNPYRFEERKNIINSNFNLTKAKVIALPDFETDELWLGYISKHIPKSVQHIRLYCGDMKNDSAIMSLKAGEDSLPFNLSITEIPRSIIPISATQVREAIENQNNDFLNAYLSKNTLEILRKLG